MPSITPFLWFNDNLEQALDFYLSVFKDARVIGEISRYGDGAPMPKGTAMSATFELCGQRFMGLNGGPMYKFTEAVSFFVQCETQEEVDHYWGRLSDGGVEQPCGWLKDRFGLSWQIIPAALGRYLSGKDRARAGRVMQAMLQMKRIDIAALDRAYTG